MVNCNEVTLWYSIVLLIPVYFNVYNCYFFGDTIWDQRIEWVLYGNRKALLLAPSESSPITSWLQHSLTTIMEVIIVLTWSTESSVPQILENKMKALTITSNNTYFS